MTEYIYPEYLYKVYEARELRPGPEKEQLKDIPGIYWEIDGWFDKHTIVDIERPDGTTATASVIQYMDKHKSIVQEI